MDAKQQTPRRSRRLSGASVECEGIDKKENVEPPKGKVAQARSTTKKTRKPLATISEKKQKNSVRFVLNEETATVVEPARVEVPAPKKESASLKRFLAKLFVFLNIVANLLSFVIQSPHFVKFWMQLELNLGFNKYSWSMVYQTHFRHLRSTYLAS